MLHQNGRDMPAKRVVQALPSEDELKKFEGEFYSDELHVLYTVSRKDGALMLTYPRGSVRLGFNSEGVFATGFPLGDIKYQCTQQGDCSGFTVNNGRVRNLRFTKVAIVGAEGHSGATSGAFLK
jgi:hypothetical protein